MLNITSSDMTSDKKKFSHLGIRIHVELQEKLKEYAVQEKRTLSNLVCMILEDYVDRKNTTK
jgi:predicted DNA-binding protein